MSDYILTYLKIKFHPLEPRIEDIRIEDIAHALSLMTRANGHIKHFFSIGQHSINCFKEARERKYSKEVQLGCLLHDASEAYISDITRPVKRNLLGYLPIEEKLQNMIYEKFGLGSLSEEDHDKIKDVDDALLYYEFMDLMGEEVFDEKPYIALEHNFSQEDFISVEKQFMRYFNILMREGNGNSFVGIDGCKGGYVAVNITDDDLDVNIFKSIDEICSKYEKSDSLIIDMPIGLPENKEDIRPDSPARKVLSSRASCIFNTPSRQAIYEKEYSDANETNRDILGKGLSKQSFAISNKIRDIDEFLEREPKWRNKLIESHPEVCFAMLNSNCNGPEPIYDNKKTQPGIDKRLELLSRYYNRTDEIRELVYSDSFKKYKDDVIDALCLAVTGMLGYENGYKTIPENPMEDRMGILMQMVYAV
jgi:predicted RNase H-like nuclease